MTEKNKSALHSAHSVLKVDTDQRIVWGWASVSTVDGELVYDAHGDAIEPHEMESAANAFMLDVRAAKAMHTGDMIGEVIHSLPLTKALADALGITCKQEGWIIAMKIHDDNTWNSVKSGKFAAFSIGGWGFRNVK